MIALFDMVNIIFGKPEEYKKVSAMDKSRNFFMLNRFFAINFPSLSNAMNINGISAPAVIDYWQSMLSQKFNRTPGWIYAKTKKEKPKATDKLSDWQPKKETIAKYLEMNRCSSKEYYNCMELFGDKFKQEIKDFEKMMGS